jgi:hypothetical protein
VEQFLAWRCSVRVEAWLSNPNEIGLGWQVPVAHLAGTSLHQWPALRLQTRSREPVTAPLFEALAWQAPVTEERPGPCHTDA